MKLRKVLSSVVAGAIAVSAMAISVSAEADVIDFEDGAFTGISMKTDDGGDKSVLSVVDYKGSKQLKVEIQDKSKAPKVYFDLDEIYGTNLSKVEKITFDMTIQSKDGEEAFGFNPPGWCGGAIGVQATGAGVAWNQQDWTLEEYDKDSVSGKMERTKFGIVDECDDAHMLVMRWATTIDYDMYIDNVKAFDADGNVVPAYGAAAEEAADEEEAAADEEEATDEEEAADEDDAAADEEAADEDDADEDDAAADEEAADEDDADADEETFEVDWNSYDKAAAEKANKDFAFGVNEQIDLYAVLGDDVYDLAKVDATFTWTAGTAWCGGAGIGNGAVLEDGSTWLSGPEYGCANANASLVDNGKATQTILDITNNPIVDAASADENGSAFASLFVQNWWNGTEAGAKLTKLTFLNANGDVIGELAWESEEAPAPASTQAPAAGDVAAATDSSKGSPDTGAADVAAVLGLAIVAGGAVLVSKKRK